MSLFRNLAECIAAGETLRLDIQRQGNTVELIAQPVLKALDSHKQNQLSDEQLLLRAALSSRFKLSGPLDEIDRTLLDDLRQFGAKRAEARDLATTFDDLDEALRQSKQVVAKQKQSAGKAAAKAPAQAEADAPAPDKPAPATPSSPPVFSDGDNPTSLF